MREKEILLLPKEQRAFAFSPECFCAESNIYFFTPHFFADGEIWGKWIRKRKRRRRVRFQANVVELTMNEISPNQNF